MPEQTNSGIRKAIEAAGSQSRLAARLGVRQQAVAKWLAKGFVPPARVIEVEQETGVPRGDLINPKLIELLDTSL